MASEQVNGISMCEPLADIATVKECILRENAQPKESQTSKESVFVQKNVSTRDRSLPPQAVDVSQRKPEIGMVFHSEEQAYRFYNLYAKRRGFSVRKGHRSRRKDGSTRVRIFLCSNEGSRQQHRTHVTKKPRALVRTNCLARIEYKVNRDNVWIVSKIIDEHNHPLMSSNKIHMLRSHRKRLLIQRLVHSEIYNTEVKHGQSCSFQEEHDHDEHNCGRVLKTPTTKLPSRRVQDLEKGDAQFLLDILKAKQLEDPSFFYAIQLDEKEQLTNFFWADARSVVDYAYFGDAVSFDTTYRASKNNIPFAPFIGVNHHKQIVLFGAALILDETVESFIWLFNTFVAAMSGRHPKTIFTNHCIEMSDAISVTLPETCHRICLWQILQNVPRHLSQVYNSEANFQKDFKYCIYENDSQDSFCNGWNNLISKYNLSSNQWLQDLYAVREKWALVYSRNAFCATMTTVEWNTNMCSYFKMYFNRKLPPSKFITQYHKALLELREKELSEDCESSQSKPVLLVDVPILSIAAESYTRTIYKDFEDEYKRQLACFCEPVSFDGTVYIFRVSLPQKHCYGIVEFNAADVTVTCSCKKFESMGILCMHALKVLNNNNILHLSPLYILKRWTRDAKFGVSYNQHRTTVGSGGHEQLSLRYNLVWKKAISIAVKSAISLDALEFVEQRLDKFMLGMEQASHNTPLDNQTEDVNDAESMQANTIDANVVCFGAFE